MFKIETGILIFALLSGGIASGQKTNPAEDPIRTVGMPVMKEIVNTPIPGAPLLSKPQLITGTKQDIRTEKHGLVYPALFDWNRDGKPDLLLGDFATGETGSFVKVYLNEGSAKRPRFSGKYFWATDTQSDTISNFQWCCIGLHPRIFDLDGDGWPDMLSGQYNPGKISWWRGSAEGFLPRQFVPQEGEPEGRGNAQDPDNPNSERYWVYTTVQFADFNGDGLPDLFVGGGGGLRVALNTGTRQHPRFGLREHLRYTDGSNLSINEADVRQGRFKTYITPIDWNGDGVTDLLVTHEYNRKGDSPVLFYEGVNTDKGLRFRRPQPLFTAADGGKVFPGCQPMICVADYNGDGVNDLLVGMSIPTVNGYEVDDSIAWGWISDFGIQMPGKDAGEVTEVKGIEGMKQMLEQQPMMRSYYMGRLKEDKYLTLRHRGYVYVMYGKKNPVAAAAPVTEKASDPVTRQFEGSRADNPVTYRLEHPDTIREGGTYSMNVILSFKKGWHGYTDSKANEALGMVPTKVNIRFPEDIQANEPELPAKTYTGATLYTGENKFSRSFMFWEPGRTEIPVEIVISYQVCDDQMCLPPEEHVIKVSIPVTFKKR